MTIRLIKFALDSLEDGGSIIVSNMVKTRSSAMLSQMANWDIIYRTPEEFADLIIKAGGQNVKVHVEPWGIFTIATACKEAVNKQALHNLKAA